MISIARSDDQLPIDSGSCAARFAVAAQVEISEGTALVDVSRKDEDAVHFNGQDPQGRAPLFDSPGLRIGSLGTLNLPLLHGDSSESPRVTQNDIVVLAGEWGTWQVVAPVNGRKADIRRRYTSCYRRLGKSYGCLQYAGSPGCSS